MAANGRDLGPILQTIREVEVSLERRSARAAGVNLMIWGSVSGSIFLFYQLVAWNPDPYVAMLGPALDWIWLAPIAFGYAASALVGARLGRFGADEEARRSYRKGMIPGAFATLVAAVLIITQRGDLVAGALLVVLGAFFVAFADRATAAGRACLVSAALFAATGIGLMAWRGETASLVAALVMGGGLLALGTWFYAAAR